MEKWTVMNHGIIPKGNYITDLRYGEDHGLLITLKNDTFCITLDFGAVVSVHCIDEGGMLFPHLLMIHILCTERTALKKFYIK